LGQEQSSEYPQDIKVQDEAQLGNVAHDWVAKLKPGDLVFLKGDLGAGKTTWVRYVLRTLGYSGKVKSPTYTIVETYEWDDRLLHHFDLYRVADSEELFYLGMEDYLKRDALVFIEWPEMGQGVLPEPNWEIQLTADVRDPNARLLTIQKHEKC